MVLNRQITIEEARLIGRSLQNERLGEFSESDLRPRPRVNYRMEGPERYKHNAGFGYFLLDKDSRILDISMYFSPSDLDLNGIFDVDRVMIPLDNKTTLADFVDKVRGVSPENLAAKGLIIDPENGYLSWIKKEQKLVRPTNLLSDPIQSAIRVVRSYAKIGKYILPDDIRETFATLLRDAPAPNRLQVVRNTLKLLEDKDAALEMKALASLGSVEKWMPALGAELKKMDPHVLSTFFDTTPAISVKTKNPEVAVSRFLKLAELLPESDRILFYNDLALAETELGQLKLAEQLERSFKLLNSKIVPSNQPFSKIVLELGKKNPELIPQIAEILKSPALKAHERDKLVMRRILRELPEMDRSAFLMREVPKIGANIRNELLKMANTERKGVYTGVFNPAHRGHWDAADKAVREMALDELIMVPTPATTHNESPEPWEKRHQIMSIELEGNPKIKVVDPSYLADLEINTGVALEKMFKENPDTHFVQVMGADSFERFAKAGRIEALGTRDVFVADRPGTILAPELLTDPRVHFSPLSGSADIGTEENRSSSMLRRMAASGASREEMLKIVRPKTADYIIENEMFGHPGLSGSICKKAFEGLGQKAQ